MDWYAVGFLLMGLLLVVIVIRLAEISAQQIDMDERINDRVTHLGLEERLASESMGVDDLSLPAPKND